MPWAYRMVGTGLLAALLLPGCQEAEPQGPPPPSAPPAALEPVVEAPEPQPRSILRDPVPPPEPEPAEAPAPEPAKVEVLFPEGRYELDAAARERLDALLERPELKTGGGIVLRGHSDSSGADRGNRKASRLRAEAVGDYLMEHGVASDRITIFALGEGAPAAPNVRPDGTDNPEGRAQNRRVEIELEAQDPVAEGEAAAPS